MKILIVDDERLARQRLAAQVGDLALGTVVGEAEDGLAALAAVATLNPDVVLLDVRMPGMDGLEAARHLRRLPRPPIVIFITAYDEHALAAFDQQALDYLLKPVRSERLHAALTRAEMFNLGRGLVTEDTGTALGQRRHVSAFVGGRLRLLPLTDIVYFQTDQGYTRAVGTQDELLIEDSLRALEDEFADALIRIHRQTLVMLTHVRGLERDAAGNVSVVLQARPEHLAVSRRLLSEVRARLRRG